MGKGLPKMPPAGYPAFLQYLQSGRVRNSVLRRPGHGSWGRARTGSWLRTNWLRLRTFLPVPRRPTVGHYHVVGGAGLHCGRGHPLLGVKETSPLSPAGKTEAGAFRAFLLPMRSLVKCIPDRPMHAGVIVMASRGIPRHQEPARA